MDKELKFASKLDEFAYKNKEIVDKIALEYFQRKDEGYTLIPGCDIGGRGAFIIIGKINSEKAMDYTIANQYYFNGGNEMLAFELAEKLKESLK